MFHSAEDTVQLKLSGEFDFLLRENIHLKLAALLTDKNTGEPISGATVTFTMYDPDLNPLVIGQLIEEMSDSGVYLYTSELTIRDMDLPKGIYLVHAHAIAPDGSEVVDIIQFHVDPPSSLSLGILVLSVFSIVFVITAGVFGRRRLNAGKG
jgi:hypothetical protein